MADADRSPVACDLARPELLRVVRRAAPDRIVRAREVLEAITLVTVGAAIFEQAGRLDPPVLCALDALHLAAALDLEAVVTHDERLAQAVRADGVTTIAP